MKNKPTKTSLLQSKTSLNLSVSPSRKREPLSYPDVRDMVKVFNEEGQIWQDSETGKIVSPPEKAENREWDPRVESWRWTDGPNQGSFAPSPEPDRPPYSFRDPQGRARNPSTGETVSEQEYQEMSATRRDKFEPLYKNPETGEEMLQRHAISRNRNIERAKIFKKWSEDTGLSYQYFQEKFQGVPTTEIRGKLIRIDSDGNPVYEEEDTDRVASIKEEIFETQGVFLQTPLEEITTP